MVLAGMRRWVWPGLSLILVWGAAAISSVADDRDPLDTALGGFDRPPLIASQDSLIKTDDSQPPTWEIHGGLDLDLAWALQGHVPPSGDVNYAGLATLRPRFSLSLDYNLGENWHARIGTHGFFDTAYSINGRNQYTGAVLDGLEQDFGLDRAYVEGPIGSVDLKLGRQVVAWGESDIFRPLDILNPVDIRDPIFADLTGLRLPVWMTRLDWDWAGWSFSGLAIHENRSNKLPPFGSDFYPFDFPLPALEEKSVGLNNTGWGLSAKRYFEGWDLSFYGASLLREQDLVGISPPVERRRINRVNLLGATYNRAWGNWLFKTDVAFLEGLEYYRLSEPKNRLDVVSGFDYTGFKDSFLTVEIAYRHLYKIESNLGDFDFPNRNILALGLLFTRSFWREQIKFSALFRNYGLDHGAVERVALTYIPVDGVRISLGVAFFQKGDNYVFQHIGKNSRVFIRYQYRF